MYYPNLLMNNPQILAPIEFKLSWWKDSEIREMMTNTYLTEECAYPDDRLMVAKIQNKANQLSEYYNKLYHLKDLAEEVTNPLYNYDRFEDTTDDGKSNSDSMNSEFPMDSDREKNVNHIVQGNTAGNVRHSHIYGNIGVQTLGDIEKSTREMYERLYELKNNISTSSQICSC